MYNKSHYKSPRRACLAVKLGALIALGSGLLAQAQPVLYSDNFDADSSASWNVFSGSLTVPDYSVLFAFDYTTNKFVRNGVTNTIPAAPNGGGKGVKMWANKNDATAEIAAVSLYPKTQVFSNDFALRFDMWVNYNGGYQGGSGSTEFATFGINHAGDKINWTDLPALAVTSPSDGVWFAITGEGGAAQDYRSYTGDGFNPAVRAQGSLGGFLDRDGDFIVEEEVFDEPDTAPFKLMFPAPAFETPGVPGKQWAQVEIRQRTNEFGGHVVTWLMNNYVIAEHLNGDAVAMAQGNVMIGNMDVFSSIANPKEDNYVIYDNVRVVDLTGIAPLPLVNVATNDDTATESPAGDNGTFTINRIGSTAAPLTVTYRMAGTASNGVDYVSLPGSVTLLAGQSSTNLTVTPSNDAKGEPTESVILVLAGSANYDLYTNVSATINLLDDNDLPIATLAAFRPAAYEGNPNRSGQFRLDFSSPYFNNVNVNLTFEGTAINGVNYQALAGSVQMPAGQTNVYLNVFPIDNSNTISNLTVIAKLAAGANYIPGTASNATVTIFNDDFSPAEATLFSDNFDVNSSANWAINSANVNCDAQFAFDYATLGIPAAPHSAGATTIGLKLRANSPALGSALNSGISVSPILTQGFTNDFRLRFDWWPNFPGPFPAGGTGSTQLGTAGITRGTIPQWPGSASTSDSVFFGFSGDGGTNPDIRVYTNAGAPATIATGVYAAPSNNNTDPYYAVFGNQDAPAGQLASYAFQTGFTAPGAPGEAWHDVVITKRGNSLTWDIDGLRMATINAESFGVKLSTNIFVGQSDINNGQTSASLDDMQCGIYDNVKVESLAVPAVSITGIRISGANAIVAFAGGADDPAVAYKIMESTIVDGAYTTASGVTVVAKGSGSFEATVPTGGAAAKFYRVRR